MKRIVSYSSPKRFQEKRRNPNSNPGLKKWPCKRLKGDHKFGEWKLHYPGLKDSGWWERFCIGCQHKEWWFAPWHEDENGFSIQDKTARPPVDNE